MCGLEGGVQRFDSVDHSALWLLLRSLGVPSEIVDLMKELYTDTVSSDSQLVGWQLMTTSRRHTPHEFRLSGIQL